MRITQRTLALISYIWREKNINSTSEIMLSKSFTRYTTYIPTR